MLPHFKKRQLMPEGPSNLPKDTQRIERQNLYSNAGLLTHNFSSAQGCFCGRPCPGAVHVRVSMMELQAAVQL